jgi:hypothetical protein
VNGFITALRFYKAPLNTGTHTANLWTVSGTLLARVTVSGETASGWQQMALPTPVPVTANTIYVASYFAPVGRYAADPNYFASAGVDAPPLHALANAVSPNGVFLRSANTRFPTNSSNATNYWVDVVFITASSSDTTPPTVTTVSPANAATGVSASANVTATFSEAMDPGSISTSTFELRDQNNALVPAAVTYNATTRVATLDPTSNLAAGLSYSARVRGGATGVKDLAGNALASDSVWFFKRSGTDTTAPAVTAFSPADGASGVSQTTTVTATFNEALSASTVNGTTFTLTGPGSFPVAASVAYDAATKTAVLTPSSSLAGGTIHTATVVGGSAGVKDVAGNALAANFTFSFTTAGVGDTTPPTVTNFSPPSGGANVSTTTVVTATFSEPMNGSTITGTTFTLRNPSNVAVPASVTYNTGTRIATLTPTSALAGTTTYTAIVSGGSSGVKDLAGNALANDATWSFTTAAAGDTTPPTVTNFTPSNGATGVSTATTVTATFSEAMNAGTINTNTVTLTGPNNTAIAASVAYDSATRVATLTPSNPLDGATSYLAIVLGGTNGVADVAGNRLASTVTWSFTTAGGTSCTGNPIVCENQKPGNPSSEWDVAGVGDTTIEGFATDISVNKGDTVRFKIDTPATVYRLDIYRLGYYGGAGARKIATIRRTTPQGQPPCMTDTASGLVDCGNWSESLNWAVPADAMSGIYVAKAVREDRASAGSHIVFVVRDDASQADILFQTSDTTWQAYNRYGGNSLYVGGPGTSPARAYKVSYNRPFTTRGATPEDWLFNAEYPMVRWLESNGYNVVYSTGVDTDRRGAVALQQHRMFMSVGHDEYWSAGQRANVEAARNAGVHLAFFSGNEIFWKTRWEDSIDGSGTPYRTLVSYKETHANRVLDPADPPIWTGTWRDPRFSPPADGGRPENALTGNLFTVNDSGTSFSLQVPEAKGKLRFWRNTSVATLAPNATATLGTNIIGYEWDQDIDNGARPPGLFQLSSTTINGASVLQDFGSTYASGTATHTLTLYRHASRALVFGAGTIQWSWGLDANHDRDPSVPSVPMQQATVNLLADMGTQPGSLQSGLVSASPSADAVAPVSTITSPSSGASVPVGQLVTITGTSADTGGGIVGGVEVSVDGGTSWRRATGTSSWTYAWTPAAQGSVTLKSRAVDDSGNIESPSAGNTVTVTPRDCPCSIWSPSNAPTVASDPDTAAIEVGVKFRADVSGFITGLRFYKSSANTGTHIGNLWANNGTLLATATFGSETASGWQQVNFGTPVSISANTIYVASYHTNVGRYAADEGFFATAGVDNAPLHAVATTVSANGVYRYGATGFPTNTFNATNYWVDVVFTPGTSPPSDTTPPTVTAFAPGDGVSGVSTATTVTVTFSEAIDLATINGNTFQLRDPLNALVPASVVYDPAARVATLTPASALAGSTTYTVTVRGGTVDPRVKDLAGNALASNITWSFTTGATTPPPPSGCPCTVWSSTTTPAVASTADSSPVELGVKFRSDVSGFVTGLRFYKGSSNTGTHVGHLWTIGGELLASVTFTNETSSGWQQATFTTPVQISANTLYVASYHTAVGFYSADSGYFASSGTDRPPLHAVRNSESPNGVYQYGSGGFPTQTFNATNYWVDVVFDTTAPAETTPPTITGVVPSNSAAGVSPSTDVRVTFNEPMNPATISTSTLELRRPDNTLVPASVTYDSAANTAVFHPTTPLGASGTYRLTVRGGSSDPRVKDAAGNALASNFSSSFSTATALPPPPPGQGPGGPILVVTNAQNPYGKYYAEILSAEGLNLFDVADIAAVNATVLGAHDVVILAEMTLTPAQITMFTDWVNSGGNLIAMRPDKQLSSLLGLSDTGSTLSNTYIKVDTSAAPGTGIIGDTIQFHGTADRYTLSDGVTVATLYSSATGPTTSPAVSLRSVGALGGHAAAFTYDLARSVVYTRQGNPAWAEEERDGTPPVRSDDLFFGAASSDPQADWIDLNKVAIPQADEQQRLLVNLVLLMNDLRKPFPRFWYLPRGLKAAVVMTGDDHGNGGTVGRFSQFLSLSPAGCSVENWECIRGTSYVYVNPVLTDAIAASYDAKGFEIGVHINTGCADWTPSSLTSFYDDQLAEFRSAYPSLPAPITNRTHCIVWSDWATQTKVERARNIFLDTNYYYWPPTWINNRPGFFTGSGMPMRLTDVDGSLIDVYHATTQMTDESGQSYPFTIDTLLDKALGPQGYYGVFTANMHTDADTSEGANAIIASAQARAVPIVTARQMLEWVDGRNASSFAGLTWNGTDLGFSINVGLGANGLQAMIPAQSAGRALTTLTIDGAPVSFTLRVVKGVQWATFPAAPGTYQATYP